MADVELTQSGHGASTGVKEQPLTPGFDQDAGTGPSDEAGRPPRGAEQRHGEGLTTERRHPKKKTTSDSEYLESHEVGRRPVRRQGPILGRLPTGDKPGGGDTVRRRLSYGGLIAGQLSRRRPGPLIIAQVDEFPWVVDDAHADDCLWPKARVG